MQRNRVVLVGRSALLWAAIGLLPACTDLGNDDPSSGEDPPVTGLVPPVYEPVAGEGEMLLKVPPHRVEVGTEVQRCWEMPFPSDVDVDVDRITWEFNQGSHHLHVYVAADGATGGETRDYDCFYAVDFEKWHLLVATQDGELDWTLPATTAFRVKARQRVLIQTHYLNTSSLGTPNAWAYGAVRIRQADSTKVQRRAGAIFGQNKSIQIPPFSEHTVTAECQLPAPGELIAMTGHFHTHGKSFLLTVLRADGTEERVYDSFGFDEPEWQTYTGMRLEAGDRFRWVCNYVNDGATPISFGPREDVEEHCNLFAYYLLDGQDAAFLPCVQE